MNVIVKLVVPPGIGLLLLLLVVVAVEENTAIDLGKIGDMAGVAWAVILAGLLVAAVLGLVWLVGNLVRFVQDS